MYSEIHPYVFTVYTVYTYIHMYILRLLHDHINGNKILKLRKMKVFTVMPVQHL